MTGPSGSYSASSRTEPHSPSGTISMRMPYAAASARTSRTGGTTQVDAVADQALAQRGGVELARGTAELQRERGRGPRRLPERHHRRREPRRRQRFVRRRDAAPGSSYEIPYRCLVPKNADDLLVAGREPPRRGPAAGRVVDVDRIRAAPYRVVEGAAGQHVVGGQRVLALDPPRLAHADLRRGRAQRVSDRHP